MNGTTEADRTIDGFPAPSWAEDVEEIDGGLQWTRTTEVAVQPFLEGGEPNIIKVTAYLNDHLRLTQRVGRPVLERGTPHMYLGDNQMTPGESRELGRALIELADLVEADTSRGDR